MGSRRPTRRQRLVTGLAVSVLAAGVHMGAAAAEPPAVTVEEQQGLYVVATRFLVAQPRSVAVAVLTDYETIPHFMPDVRRSIVLERGERYALVEQEAVSRLLMFSKRVHLVLEVREAGGGIISFRDLCGWSFAIYEGRWRLSDTADGVAIEYELRAQPAFDVPAFLVRRLLERDAERMIEALQAEIAARQTGERPEPRS